MSINNTISSIMFIWSLKKVNWFFLLDWKILDMYAIYVTECKHICFSFSFAKQIFYEYIKAW